jgi:hypothetical protein
VVCELGSIEMVRTLGWFRDFLETHPDEFLILFIEDKVSPTDTAAAFEKSGILHYAYVHKPGKPFPTVRELIESDKRLFVMAEEEAERERSPGTTRGSRWRWRPPSPFARPRSSLRL